jgi:hypothetical protein
LTPGTKNSPTGGQPPARHFVPGISSRHHRAPPRPRSAANSNLRCCVSSLCLSSPNNSTLRKPSKHGGRRSRKAQRARGSEEAAKLLPSDSSVSPRRGQRLIRPCPCPHPDPAHYMMARSPHQWKRLSFRVSQRRIDVRVTCPPPCVTRPVFRIHDSLG